MEAKLKRLRELIRQKFVFNTCNNIFILLFINAMGFFAGQVNLILAVSLIVIILSSATRDMLGTPVKHFFLQLGAMALMTTTATLSYALPLPAALASTFAAVFLLVYFFTFETGTHMYFPYLLGFLFLRFIAPVGFDRLAPRLICCLISAVVLLGYQFIVARHRVREVHRGCLLLLVAQARAALECLTVGQGTAPTAEEVHRAVLSLSKEVYDRRRGAVALTDAQCAALDAGRGLEHLTLTLLSLEGALQPECRRPLLALDAQLALCTQFLEQRRDRLDPPCESGISTDPPGPVQRQLLLHIDFIMGSLTRMADPALRRTCRPHGFTRRAWCLAVLAPAPVRVHYALRMAVILTLFTLPVVLIPLKYGKWLMFTLGSVCLPYADDSPTKAKKRVIATLAGGALAVAVFSVVHDPVPRTIAMILMGYFSSYFTEYTGTYACATFGALGGAVFMTAFHPADVGTMYLLRIAYIVVGSLLALVLNVYCLPYRRAHATEHLQKRYAALSERIAALCAGGDTSSQCYYSAVVHLHLIEDKLRQNYQAAREDGLELFINRHRTQMRDAHTALFGITPLESLGEAWVL